MSDNTKFIVTALGIFFSYFIYGILQEKVTRGKYGADEEGNGGEKFTFTLTLVGVQCLWNWIFAKGLGIAKRENEDRTHSGYYASAALTYLLGMVSSNMALQWVPYPTQVIGKSAKPIPVMLLGVLIGNKSYSTQRYICVLIIVIGVVMFTMKESKIDATNAVDQSPFGIGEILLILSLAMDGLTGAIQDRMRAAHAPTAQHMMLAMNRWSTLMLAVLVVFTGEIFEFIPFAMRYPSVLVQLGLLAFAGAIGQLFIFTMVSSFGPLACSVVTTTRKFFTVLCSVLFFRNALSNRQWIGATLVFAGLFADAAFGKKPSKK